MGREVLHVPIVQLLNIGDAVETTFRFQEVGVFAEEACVDDSSAEVFSFEMWVRKAHEYLQ